VPTGSEVTARAPVVLSGRVAELLDSQILVHVSTVGPGQQPQASVVWAERQGNEVAFFALADSVKVRNLSRDPRVVLLIVDPERVIAPGIQAYARLTGVATLNVPGDPSLPHRLARKYMGLERYPYPLESHVDIRVRINSVTGLGLP
jgi:PPOX class probable F420-dependent enzyme